jgi:hypothetical protein
MDNETIKDITLMIGVSTPIVTLIINSYFRDKESKLKEKELSQKITQSKQQELFEKEIDTYQELYALTIEYKEQKHKIGSPNSGSKTIQYRTGYMLFSNAFKSILNCIEKNIFYVSEKLDKAYHELNDAYEMEFASFYNAEEEYDKDNNITRYEGYCATEEGENLYVKAQEKFYIQNKDKIELILSLIQDEFMKKRL